LHRGIKTRRGLFHKTLSFYHVQEEELISAFRDSFRAGFDFAHQSPFAVSRRARATRAVFPARRRSAAPRRVRQQRYFDKSAVLDATAWFLQDPTPASMSSGFELADPAGTRNQSLVIVRSRRCLLALLVSVSIVCRFSIICLCSHDVWFEPSCA